MLLLGPLKQALLPRVRPDVLEQTVHILPSWRRHIARPLEQDAPADQRRGLAPQRLGALEEVGVDAGGAWPMGGASDDGEVVDVDRVGSPAHAECEEERGGGSGGRGGVIGEAEEL